jgi:hypothetical protein
MASAIPTPTTPAPTAPNSDFISALIPGFGGLNSKSSDVINNLLTGSPNPGTVQNAAATFGAQNGQGAGSGIANKFGFDLYNEMGNQRQQQGLSDLSGLIGSIAQPTLENQGQNQQNQQFYSNLGQSAAEFNTSQQNENNRQMAALLAQLAGQSGGESVGPAQFRS